MSKVLHLEAGLDYMEKYHIDSKFSIISSIIDIVVPEGEKPFIQAQGDIRYLVSYIVNDDYDIEVAKQEMKHTLIHHLSEKIADLQLCIEAVEKA